MAGSFNGNDTADIVTNRGTKIGQVLLSDGSDVLDGRGELFEGQVLGGNRMDFRSTDLMSGVIFGGAGLDTTPGTEGDDTINDDADSLYGDAGDFLLLGGNQDDVVFGGAGDDTLNGGAGSSTLFGDAGNDVLVPDGAVPLATLIADGGAGNDQIQAGTRDGSIRGGDGDDTIPGFDGNDTVLGGTGDDLNDLFNDADTGFGGQGDDMLPGGEGNDIPWAASVPT